MSFHASTKQFGNEWNAVWPQFRLSNLTHEIILHHHTNKQKKRFKFYLPACLYW